MEKFNRKEFILELNASKRLTTEEFINRGKKVYGDRFDYSKTNYVTARDKVTITCKEHGDFTILPRHHFGINSISGGCKKCGTRVINRKRRFTQEEFIERVKNISGLDFSKTIYKDKRSFVIVTCNIHGDYKTKAEVLLKGCGCPKCKSSTGESIIEDILKESNIKYFTQQTFKGLRYKRSLKFDFYLPYYNICIEYDGEQHFKPIDYWGGIERYKELQEKDRVKEEFCIKNNISLLRIRFDEINIKERILSFIENI